MNQKQAYFRVCASCEWVFDKRQTQRGDSCPKCCFASYGARFVYGSRAYLYAKTQKPWLNKKLEALEHSLRLEITLARKVKEKPWSTLSF